MPVVLVLFAIALVITLTGVFLSPKAQQRRSPNRYVVMPEERSVVKNTPTSGHMRARWAEMTEAEIAMVPLKARASRAQTQVVRSQVVRPRMTTRVAIQAINSDFWGNLSSWKVVVPGLSALFLLGFYLLSTTLAHPLLWVPAFFGPTHQSTTSAPATTPTYAASQHLLRLGQLDPAQYSSTQQYNTWAYSACSSASMTEVMNAYGHSYRVTDILNVEARIHEITPELGLLEESGIQHTGEQFGFKTIWGHNLSLDQVIAAANRGTPVIISFPPAKYAGGHILVVRGGNASTVYLADSSRLNWTQLTRARFMQLWGGFSAIMTPK